MRTRDDEVAADPFELAEDYLSWSSDHEISGDAAQVAQLRELCRGADDTRSDNRLGGAIARACLRVVASGTGSDEVAQGRWQATPLTKYDPTSGTASATCDSGEISFIVAETALSVGVQKPKSPPQAWPGALNDLSSLNAPLDCRNLLP